MVNIPGDILIVDHACESMHKADKTEALLMEFALKHLTSHLPRINRNNTVPSKLNILLALNTLAYTYIWLIWEHNSLLLICKSFKANGKC